MKLTTKNLDSSYFPEWVISDRTMYKINKLPTVEKLISGIGMMRDVRKFAEVEIQSNKYLVDVVTGTLWRDGKCITSGTLRMEGICLG